ncbi:MAG: hypothetical protein V5A57_02580 [Candidatus Paceibacterota bacterium]
MKFKKGNKRYVVVIGTWIAIKFPKIQFLTALRILWSTTKIGRPLMHFKRYDYTMGGSIQNFLFAGLIENWKEFVYWKRFHFSWLAPTYFSLLGLITVQKAGKELKLENKRLLWTQIINLVGNQLYEADDHAFASVDNYVKINETVCLVDYGSFKNENLFTKQQQRLNEFVFDLKEVH